MHGIRHKKASSELSMGRADWSSIERVENGLYSRRRAFYVSLTYCLCHCARHGLPCVMSHYLLRGAGMEITSKRKGLPLRSRTRQFERLRRELQKTRSILLDQAFNVPQRSNDQAPAADPIDIATDLREETVGDILTDRVYVKLQQIEQALIRMRDASYGICRSCQEDIPIERLKVQPETIYCVECKERNEHSSSLRGKQIWS
ncbi:MAG: TraR/DksA family transcriptional regulator [Nitrospiraceae bacterium]